MYYNGFMYYGQVYSIHGGPNSNYRKLVPYEMMKHKITHIGVLLTVLYVAAIVVLNGSIWEEIHSLKLNELGDFLAGTFGPLTLLWLILSFIQQQHELRATTKALDLQAEELKRSVEQYSIIAEATNRQLELATIEHRLSTLPIFELFGQELRLGLTRARLNFKLILRILEWQYGWRELKLLNTYQMLLSLNPT